MHLEEKIIQGLKDAVSITVDKWGIAHIQATNKQDLFFAQGYNAARDRLWQIDLWRKRGLGLLSADFGPGYIEQDNAARLFLYRGNMEAEWDAYCPDAKEIAAAFVAGINAYIATIEADSDLLPPEFGLFGTMPALWKPEDIVRIRSHSLMRNALSEVIRANVMNGASADIDLLRQDLSPTKAPVIPEGLDITDIPLAVLDTFKLALAAVTFEDARLNAKPEDASAWRKIAATGEVVRDAAAQGSNNWVVHGSRTETGRPIMANDPHRTHAVPSLRYLVHLKCPEFDVIGAGEPCLPGICIGHNGTSAFGLTLFFGHDQEDVYVYETASDDPDLYRYGDGWERMTIIDETSKVSGYEDCNHRLRFTRHGPVIYEDKIKNRVFAIRSVWFDPGTAPYFASIATMRSKDYQSFRSGMARWGVPATNQVYADVRGDIGWVVAGFSPIRPNWDGLLPVPGDGRYEWQGYLPGVELPYALNPEKGFFATANEQNLPSDWPHDAKPIGYEWLERSRIDRIDEVLRDDKNHSVAASGQLQADDTSLPARRLASLIRVLPNHRDEIAKIQILFSDWDHRLSVDSAAAAFFEVWWSKHLRPALFEKVTQNAAIRVLLAPGDVGSVLNLLEKPDARLGGQPDKTRDALLVQSIVTAFEECTQRMGNNVTTWRWGSLHQAYFEHATSRVRKDKGRPNGDVGPLEKGGSDSTPMNASYRTSDFRVTLGASVRVVVDVGDWDNSICINAPGQSGNPESQQYKDLASIWAEGNFVPLFYSDAKVIENGILQIQLSS